MMATGVGFAMFTHFWPLFVIAVVGTVIILKILDAAMGLRVSQEDEIQGLDLSQHGEEGYIFH